MSDHVVAASHTFIISAILVAGTPSCSTATAVMRNLSLTSAAAVVDCAAISTALVDPAPRQYMDGRTLYLSGDVVLILYTTGRSLELAMVNLRAEIAAELGQSIPRVLFFI